MKQRTITGIVLLAIFLPLLIVEQLFVLFQILMLFLCVIASREMIRLYEQKKPFPKIMKWIVMISSALIYMSALTEWANFADQSRIEDSLSTHTLELFNLSIGFLPMLLLVIIIFFCCMIFIKGFDGEDIGKALTVICYTGLCFGALTILRFLGLRYIVYLFMITILTDVFAYVGGSICGKHKMCPLISPHKTWEGAVIGSLTAVVVSTTFAFCYGIFFKGNFLNPNSLETLFSGSGVFWKGSIDGLSKPLQFLAIAVITLFVSIAGQLGDLVASKLKRTYGLKDYGTIFPGHGGVLDRLDSAIFAALSLLMLFVLL